MPEIILNDSNFEAEVLRAELPVFVDFWAPWCMPCRRMGPIVEKLAEEYEGKIKVCKLNVEENPNTAMSYKIMTIPTVIIFKNGTPIEQSAGLLPEEEFKKKLDALL